jgi:hypothetical protein
MASIPAGSVIGAFVSTRWVSPEQRDRAIILCAVTAGVSLICARSGGHSQSLSYCVARRRP